MENGKLFESKILEVKVADIDGYTLIQKNYGLKGFVYAIYDPEGVLVYSWRSFLDVTETKNLKSSGIYQMFSNLVDQDKSGNYESNPYDDYDPYIEDDEEEVETTDDVQVDDDDVEVIDKEDAYYDDDDIYYDDYDYYSRYYDFYDHPYSRKKPLYGNSYNYWKSDYTPKPKQRLNIEEYSKSDTLVFHKDDPSTRMLCQIYDGKNWDVLTHTYDIETEDIITLMQNHDRLVFLGHGTSYGLMGMFGPELAPYMKNKKIFAIWCNADAYFNKYGVGQGQFVTGNMPSESYESVAAGCGNISKELMLDNITYWSKLCADVTEACLEGRVKESVNYIRKNYLEQYGNHPVTIYNANRTQVLGEPQELPKYEFKGKPLEPKDFPVPSFDEKAFLEHPVEKAYDCPRKIEEIEVEKEEPKQKTSLPYFRQLDLFDDDD